MECLRGDFVGEMKSGSKDTPLTCRKCKQPNCQGRRVEFAANRQAEGAGGKKGGGGGVGAKKSSSPAKKSSTASSSGAAKKSKKKKK